MRGEEDRHDCLWKLQFDYRGPWQGQLYKEIMVQEVSVYLSQNKPKGHQYKNMCTIVSLEHIKVLVARRTNRL